jgi:hypothetical protein
MGWVVEDADVKADGRPVELQLELVTGRRSFLRCGVWSGKFCSSAAALLRYR